VKLIDNRECKTKDKIVEFHDFYVQKGFEGLMIRNKLGFYRQKYRSSNLQKLKEFDHTEYEIVSFTEGEGNNEGLIIFTCSTGNGTFDTTMKSSHEARRDMFSHGEDYVGNLLTVKHFGFTDDKKPRFPVGISIRNYE
jgi:DNA ligase-1